MSRKNGKKLLIAVGAVAIKVVRDGIKAKKQEEELRSALLVGQGAGVKSIEVTDDNIKAFERVARKYNVDFTVKWDKTTEPPKYLVFLRARMPM